MFVPKRRRLLLPLKVIILRMLSDGPMHGYEIRRKIEELTEGAWRPSFSIIYPLLRTMLHQKLIKRETIQKGKKTLFVYGITEKGKEALSKMLEDLVEMVLITAERAKRDPYSALPLIFLTNRLGQSILELFPAEVRKKTLSILSESLKKLLRRVDELLAKEG